ncbi:putative mitochondrion protein [Exidia glandulosa HHB12029]|uniref:Putative mitochondrion protein n=1 Tax=Exidia glandulosa HHB12029 TaxID=1314781 RepID=A0A165GER1_EXIGL|nr:putative mitochondrion protein [Exidia glandulosa HHB12029]
MALAAQRLLVVGGNGFVGSAICKAALARGWQVTSISSSGKPYQTPKGHSPSWVSQVEWHAADALEPASYAPLMEGRTSVVHALGTLLEDTRYKAALKSGDVLALASAFASSASGGNPLKTSRSGYDALNRDSALRVFETFAAAQPEGPHERAFVYISAEDVFGPFVPPRYVQSKREAEEELARLATFEHATAQIRPVFLRPGLIYHAHLRPLTSPAAAALSASATLHGRVPPGFPLPTPAGVLRSLSGVFPPLSSVANALVTHPIHVDHVASAACASIETHSVSGPLGVREMRRLIGWPVEGDLGNVAMEPNPSV